MNFKAQESATKLRGGYYTPIEVSRFLTRWVLKNGAKRILEPSCGDGSFIRSFENLHDYHVSLTGVELLEEEAAKSRQAATDNKLLDTHIINCDFLEWALDKLEDSEPYDAVIGNPPYIRYQYLEASDQKLSERLFSKYQLAFTKHTNAWVPFVIASLALLAPGGRLAMVIPSELLHILHAGSLRKFLISECSRILMIDPNELLFEEALQGAVLLMVEKKKIVEELSKGVAIVSAPDNDFLSRDPDIYFENANYVSGEVLNGKWMKVLLSSEEVSVFEMIRKRPNIRRFKDIASVDVGIVTGANQYFLVTSETVAKYDLSDYAKPMFGRSEHCPGVIYDEKVHKDNEARGLPTNFIMFGNTPVQCLPLKAQDYVRLGETQNLQNRYKCRIRNPWYAVPSVYATPVGMLKRSHNYPKLILNAANAYTTDTAYRIRILDSGVPAEILVFSFVNSLTALTAELEGRHYAGGVLELVPSEIEKLLVPVSNNFRFELEKLDTKIKTGIDADTLLSEQDQIILKAAGLSDRELETIHEAWRRIRIRRQRLVGDNN